MAELIDVTIPGQKKSYPLKDVTSIGRSSTTDIKLDASLFHDTTQGSAKSKEEFEQFQKRLKIFHDITRVVGNIFDLDALLKEIIQIIFTGIVSQIALLIYSAELFDDLKRANERIASENKNLKKQQKVQSSFANIIGSGEFREDLFYQLNVAPIHLPPL